MEPQYNSDLMKVQVIKTYFDRSYTAKSGKNLRFIIGRFKQNASGGKLRFRGAMVVVNDSEEERETVEVYRQPNAVRQLKLRISGLYYLARTKAEPEEFLDEISDIINNTSDIEEQIKDLDED